MSGQQHDEEPMYGPYPEDYYSGRQQQHRSPLPSEISSVPLFRGDGTDDHEAHHWIETLKQYSRLWRWAEESKMMVARLRMAGPAHHWMSSVSSTIGWEAFEREFINRFGERPEAALDRLANCRQEDNEPLHSYADRFRRDMHLAGRAEDTALHYQFINGLHRRLKIEVKRQEDSLHTLADIVALAKRWEDYYDDEHRHRDPGRGQRTPAYIPPYRRDYGPYHPGNRSAEAPRPSYPLGSGLRPNTLNSARPFPTNQGRPPYQGSSYNHHNNVEQNPSSHTNQYRSPEASRPYYPQQESNRAATQRSADTEAIDEITRRLKNLEISMAQDARAAYRAADVQYFEPSFMMTEHEDQIPPRRRSNCTGKGNSPMPNEYKAFIKQEIRYAIQEALACAPVMAPAEVDHMEPAVFQQDQLPILTTSTKETSPQEEHQWMEKAVKGAPEEDNMSSFSTAMFMDYVSDEEEDWPYPGGPMINYSTEPMYIKGQGDETTYQRMPRKKVAFDTGAASAIRPPQAAPGPWSTYPGNPPAGPTAPSRPAGAAARPSNLRTPAPQRAQTPGALPGAQAPRVPLTDPTRRADLLPNLPADVLAESKGKEMAIKACRSINVDAATDSDLIIPAAKLCSAGHIINDSQLIEKGKDLARRTENFIRRQYPPGGATAGASAAGPSNAATMQVNNFELAPGNFDFYTALTRCKPSHKMLSEVTLGPSDDGGADPSMVPTRMSNLRAKVRIGSPSVGVAFDTIAIVDTGASQCAVTLTTLKRMGLAKAIDFTKKTVYTTASGDRAHSLGTLPDFPVTIGKLTTKVDFNVTDALSYDVLLGLDFLKTIGAVINLRTNRISYELTNDLEGVADAICMALQQGGVEHQSINMLEQAHYATDKQMRTGTAEQPSTKELRGNSPPTEPYKAAEQLAVIMAEYSSKEEELQQQEYNEACQVTHAPGQDESPQMKPKQQPCASQQEVAVPTEQRSQAELAITMQNEPPSFNEPAEGRIAAAPSQLDCKPTKERLTSSRTDLTVNTEDERDLPPAPVEYFHGNSTN